MDEYMSEKSNIASQKTLIRIDELTMKNCWILFLDNTCLQQCVLRVFNSSVHPDRHVISSEDSKVRLKLFRRPNVLYPNKTNLIRRGLDN